MAKIDYDEEFDILYLHEGRKVKFSIEAMENFVIDVGFDGKVVGLEIMEASKELKAAKTDLEKVKDAKIATLSRPQYCGVSYAIRLGKSTLESEIRLPTGCMRAGQRGM